MFLKLWTVNRRKSANLLSLVPNYYNFFFISVVLLTLKRTKVWLLPCFTSSEGQSTASFKQKLARSVESNSWEAMYFILTPNSNRHTLLQLASKLRSVKIIFKKCSNTVYSNLWFYLRSAAMMINAFTRVHIMGCKICLPDTINTKRNPKPELSHFLLSLFWTCRVT